MKTEFSNINKDLSIHWLDKKCTNCGRGYPDTILNIEEVLHHNHGKGFRCVDSKECMKFKKKRNK